MSDEPILMHLAEAEGPLTTPQVARHLGISKPATWKRLTDLYNRDLVDKHQPSELHGESWTITDQGRAFLRDVTDQADAPG